METKRSLAYLQAKKKVDALKSFYSHLAVFIIVNCTIILFSANVFNARELDFADWTNYITTFFWGIGLVFHGLYVFFLVNVNNNILKRWEDKKMKQFLEEDEFSKY